MKIKEPMYATCLEKATFIEQEQYLSCEYTKETIEDRKQSHLKINECTFTNMQFIGCQFPCMEGIDLVFDHCDLSNISFEESALHRIVFKHCRMIGCDFSKSFIRHVQFINCKACYTNFSFCNAKEVLYEECDLSEASYNESTLKNTRFSNCNLSSVEFIHTPLANIDISTSDISGIVVTSDALKEVIVNQYQAIELSKLLGLQIKD